MKPVLFVLALWTLYGCGNTAIKHSALNDLSWLQGTWSYTDSDMVSYEVWTKQNDSVYAGRSFSLKGADTVFQESVTLIEKHDTTWYIPTVHDQNGGQPVSFRLVSATGNTFIFENKEHDFPQRVGYSHPSADSVLAWIEGTDKGVFKKIPFPMKRK